MAEKRKKKEEEKLGWQKSVLLYAHDMLYLLLIVMLLFLLKKRSANRVPGLRCVCASGFFIIPKKVRLSTGRSYLRISRTDRSLTLVPVGPVRIRPSHFFSAW